MAAFTSRLRTELHLGQVHDLSFSVSSSLMCPQLEQVFDDGAKRPIRRMFLPYQSALYSSMVTKVDQLTSLIACAKLWFLTIFLTAKSSMQIVWFSLINFIDVLCRKSLRLFTTFSCIKARRFFVLLPLFFEYLRCTYFNLLCAFRKFFGFSNTSPLEVIAKSLIPKSIPIVMFSLIGALIGISTLVSTNIDAKYFPVGVTLIVALLIVPLISLCKIISIPSLNLGITNLLLDIITFCGTEKDCLPRCFDLNFGKPAPLKNLEYAVSRLSKADCNDWLFTSLSHSHSFLRSFSCTCKSYLERFTLLPMYALVFVSRAKLYTNRLLPICLVINSFWELLGYIIYFRALYIDTKISILTKTQRKSKKILTLYAIHPTHAKAMSWISC